MEELDERAVVTEVLAETLLLCFAGLVLARIHAVVTRKHSQYHVCVSGVFFQHQRHTTKDVGGERLRSRGTSMIAILEQTVEQ